MSTVFFTVAQEYISSKRSPDLCQGLVSQEDRIKKGLQFCLKRERRRIAVSSRKALEIPALPVEQCFKSRLLKYRKDRDAVLYREGELRISGAALFRQEPACHRNDEKIHMQQVKKPVLRLSGRNLPCTSSVIRVP